MLIFDKKMVLVLITMFDMLCNTGISDSFHYDGCNWLVIHFSAMNIFTTKLYEIIFKDYYDSYVTQKCYRN